MEFTAIDYGAFAAYIVVVVAFAMYMSRKEESSEDYFLAGRMLTWWLIGISLIASNISTEHFVGMAGQGYSTGLAVASYEWTAAAAMVVVAIFLLPKFLRSGIYTIPEYLEYRYSSAARGLMAFYMMIAYVFVIISAVLYAGALGLDKIFGESIRRYFAEQGILERIDLPGMLGSEWVLVLAVWMIGIIAGLYTVWGGLKAVVWADLFNGLGLILGGIIVTFLGFAALGDGQGLAHGVTTFFASAGDKLSAVKPWDHPWIPWVAVFIGGLWIPQFFYWGLNQFITQRALGAKSVAEGQRGVMFAACLKLLMPFIIVFPGIMAFELYAGHIDNPDKAYPHMIQAILPAGLRGLMLAALFGAVMSSLDSMLNSASTILTMDLYKRHLNPAASERRLILLGRVMTALFVVIACFWAPQLGWIAGGEGVFDYIQKTWGFITPAIVAVFFFGLFSRRTPAQAALGAMLLGPPFYMWCLYAMKDVAFLHHMAFTFIVLSIYMFLVTLLGPLRDVEESSEAQPWDERQPSRTKHILIPWMTAIFGACLMAAPIYEFCKSTIPGVQKWGWSAIAAAAVAAYLVAAIWILRLPGPSFRRVAAPGKRSVGKVLGALVTFPIVALVGAAIVGLHVYLFTIWAWPEPCQQYLEQKYGVTVPWLLAERGPVPEGVQEEIARAAGFVVATRTLEVSVIPGAISAAVVLLFLVALVMMWRAPATAETEVPVTDKIELVPSPWIKLWGLVVLLAVVCLYWCFF